MLHDPTTLQQRASNPDVSAWVAANAGSGKTKVLVDRVLRLLLQGTPPDHILCITFTKAAAAQMRTRLVDRLREWVLLSEQELYGVLVSLSGTEPPPTIMKTARQLFARLNDATQGVRIQTIHSFCQNVLNQFPYEAGIAPHFTLLDEAEAQELVKSARSATLAEAYDFPDGVLAGAIDFISETTSEFTFDGLIKAIAAKQRELAEIFRRTASVENAIIELYYGAGIPLQRTTEQCTKERFDFTDEYRGKLQRCLDVIAAIGSTNDKKYTEALREYLQHPYNENTAHQFASSYLTDDGRQRAKFPTKAIESKERDVFIELQALGGQCEKYLREWNHLHNTQQSAAMLLIAETFLRHYSEAKNIRHALDYDDLIVKTSALLENTRNAPWVLYKLDGQIDHLLIDEAQDTSALQWQMTERLTEEFFASAGGDHQSRSLFVVGDEKQSIFSFQGAAPREFVHQKNRYHVKADASSLTLESIPMQTSFRSSIAVLSLVDAVFAEAEALSAVSAESKNVLHHAHRMEVGGKVILYPVIEKDTDEDMATCVAKTIETWLREGRVLANGRPMTAGDILILVQSRTTLVEPMLRALGAVNVPTAGLDRLTLRSHIAVKDMMALAAFLCNHSDDMALGCILTSPLYAIPYDIITALATARGERTLWDQLSDDEEMESVVTELSFLQTLVHSHTPHSLYSALLLGRAGMARFVARMGEGVRDILSSFLHLCKRYEASNTVSLQLFVEWVQQGEGTIKRDMDQVANEVRIMTVHGAKGLEAPIVILPDTMHSVDMKKEILFSFQKDSMPLMLYWGGDKRKARASGIFHQAYTERMQALGEESLRLLYVAMTRACDELHIFGAEGRQTEEKVSKTWYGRIHAAMQTLGASHDEGRYVLEPLTQTLSHSSLKKEVRYSEKHLLPLHFMQPISSLPKTDTLIRPSSLVHYSTVKANETDGVGGEKKNARPASAVSAAQYGTLIHACLQAQVNIPFSSFLRQLPTLLLYLAPEINQETHEYIVNDMAALVAYPDIIALLEMPALAEIPLMGYLADGQGISGQMDRLIIHENTVHIVDFKTGETGDYASQLDAYHRLLSMLYPAVQVHASLCYVAPHPRILPYL
jgi:ATP-dependent helicase/nuclease subunit A